MVQSFACNIQNNCYDLDEFEDIPSYPGSKLNAIIENLQPIIYNDTVQEFNKAVPKILLLLNATAKAINKKHVQDAIQDGLHFQENYMEIFLKIQTVSNKKIVVTKFRQFMDNYFVKFFLTLLKIFYMQYHM